MSEEIMLILVVVGMTVMAGIIGGALGYAGASAAWRRGIRSVDVELEVETQVIQCAVQTRIPLAFDVPAVKLVVPVEIETVQPVGSKAEMAARILLEAPLMGVREMARILDVSPSTASGYMAKCSAPEHPTCSEGEQGITLPYTQEMGK